MEMFSRTVSTPDDALRPTLLGDEPHAAPDRLPGCGRVVRLAPEEHPSRVERLRAEHDPRELGAARADDPGQADDLAGTDDEVDAADLAAGTADALETEGFLARRSRTGCS